MTNVSSPEVQGLTSTPEVREYFNYEVEAGSANLPFYGEGGYDRMVSRNDLGLYAVADGVGVRSTGHGSLHTPDIASEAAVSAVESMVEGQPLLKFNSVDEVIGFGRALMFGARSNIKSAIHEGQIGETTLALALLVDINDQPHILAANAGDSRIQLFNGAIPGFPKMTDVTEEQCVPGSRNVIYNCLSSESMDGSQDEIKVLPITHSETLILASDGVTGDKDSDRLSVDEYASAIKGNNAQKAADNLLELSRERKLDDKSVIVVNIVKKRTQPESKLATLTESLREKANKAATFIAGLGIAQKVRSIDATKLSAKTRLSVTSTGRRVKEASLNGAAWTQVKADKVATAVTSKETYTNARDRVTTAFARTKDSLTKLYLNTENHIVSLRKKPEDLTEEQLKHRRWVLNGAIAAVAVWGVYKAWNGMHSGADQHNFLTDILPGDQSDGKNDRHRNGVHHPHHHGNQTHGHHHHHDTPEDQPVPKQAPLAEHGATIWGSIDDIADQRGVHLTDTQTYDLVSQTLHHNGLTWEDARHLPVGYNFTIPEEVRRQIEEQAAAA